MKPREVEAYVASWIEILTTVTENLPQMVEAYVASWIEIGRGIPWGYSLVVEAYVASWIEIVRLRTCIYIRQTSRLT